MQALCYSRLFVNPGTVPFGDVHFIKWPRLICGHIIIPMAGNEPLFLFLFAKPPKTSHPNVLYVYDSTLKSGLVLSD